MYTGNKPRHHRASDCLGSANLTASNVVSGDKAVTLMTIPFQRITVHPRRIGNPIVEKTLSYNGISYTGKMSYSYWISPLVEFVRIVQVYFASIGEAKQVPNVSTVSEATLRNMDKFTTKKFHPNYDTKCMGHALVRVIARYHYSDVAGNLTFCLTVWSGEDQWKHKKAESMFML